MIQRFSMTILTFLLLVTACKRTAPQLTFAVGGAPSEIDYWQKIIDEFTDSTHIDVVLLRQPTDTDQRRQGLVIPLKAAQSDPDIFLMDVIWVAQFAASDWLSSLEPLIIREELDTSYFFATIIKQVDTYDEDIIALPVYNDCGLLYYRKDLLDKYGFDVPETWQDLLTSAKAIQDLERPHNPQFYGFVWQGAQYEGLICNYLEFLGSSTGSMVNTEGKVSIATQKSIDAVNMMKDLIHKYLISPPNTYTEMKEEEVRQLFENGNALYERNWPYAWGLHRNERSPVQQHTEMTVLPKAEGGKHVATLGGWHVGVSKYSDKKEHAFELLKYIVSYHVQKRLALELGWNPGRSDLYDDKEIKQKMPQIAVLKQAFKSAIARPTLPYYTQISSIMQRYLNSALAGAATPVEALTRAQEEIDTVVQKYNE